VLVLFTDGVVDAMNSAGEQLEMHRLCAAIEEVHGEPVSVIRDYIVRKVGEWTHVQEDDVTLLVARYTRVHE
jgi:serine phosphatase RsbU (regulator of sigma subunit)